MRKSYVVYSFFFNIVRKNSAQSLAVIQPGGTVRILEFQTFNFQACRYNVSQYSASIIADEINLSFEKLNSITRIYFRFFLFNLIDGDIYDLCQKNSMFFFCFFFSPVTCLVLLVKDKANLI